MIADLIAWLQGSAPYELCGGRIFPGRRPARAVPALVLRRISGPRELRHSGDRGAHTARIQCDCWGTDHGNAAALAAALIEALHGYRGPMGTGACERAQIANEYDPEEGSREQNRITVDALIRYREVA